MNRWEGGGKAMCDSDDYLDPALAEEMHWHAFEQAISDAHGGEWILPYRPWDLEAMNTVMTERGPLHPGQELTVQLRGEVAVLRVRDDSHLLEEAFGMVEVLCTVTPR